MSRYVSTTLKKLIDERDLGLCRYCGCTPQIKEYDHVIPYSSGGLTDISNLVLACFDCNRDKSDATWVPIPIGQTWGKDQRFREKPIKRNFYDEKRALVIGSKDKKSKKPKAVRQRKKERELQKKGLKAGKSDPINQAINEAKSYASKGNYRGLSKKEQRKRKEDIRDQNQKRALQQHGKFCFICKKIGANRIDKEGNFYHIDCWPFP